MGIFTYSRIISSVILRHRCSTQNAFSPITTSLLFSTPTSLRILSTHVKMANVLGLDEALMESLRKVLLEIVRIR